LRAILRRARIADAPRCGVLGLYSGRLCYQAVVYFVLDFLQLFCQLYYKFGIIRQTNASTISIVEQLAHPRTQLPRSRLSS
jgi:hypothetical protein